MTRSVRAAGLMCLMLLPGLGCNTSRYGVAHDQRWPETRRVAIVSMDVAIFSWHAGGDKEPRIDYTDEVRPHLLEQAVQLIRKKGFEPVIVVNRPRNSAHRGRRLWNRSNVACYRPR